MPGSVQEDKVLALIQLAFWQSHRRNINDQTHKIIANCSKCCKRNKQVVVIEIKGEEVGHALNGAGRWCTAGKA